MNQLIHQVGTNHNPTNKTNHQWCPNKPNNWRIPSPSHAPIGNQNWRPPTPNNGRPPINLDQRFQNRSNRPPSRPYQGFYQICGIQGHKTKRCPSFQVLPIQSSTIAPSSSNNSTAPWQPRVNFMRTAHHQTRAGYSTVAPLIMSQLI